MMDRFLGRLATPPAAPRLWACALLGVVLGAVPVLLWQLPAAWAAHALHRAQAGAAGVRLHGAAGTVWNGSATLGLAGGEGSQAEASLPGRVHWTMRLRRTDAAPWLGLRLQLRQDCCPDHHLRVLAQADARQGWHAVLEDLRWTAPASLLAGLGAPWNTLAPDGTLELQAGRWRLGHDAGGGWRHEGQAVLHVRKLASPISTVRPLGSYEVRVQAAGAAQPAHKLSFRLQTLHGPLELEGDGQWLPNGRWRVNIEAGAQAQYRESLRNLLMLIGNRNGPVRLRVRP